MTSVRPESRPLLSLTPVSDGDVRHGSRSLMTCLFKCGNACDHEVPNASDNTYVRDVVDATVGRRSILRGAAVGSGALVLAGMGSGLAAAAVEPAARRAPVKGGPLATRAFRPVPPNTRDAVVVPPGFGHNVVIRWGDPVLPGAPAFDPANLTVDAVKKQFGYNNDYVGVTKLTSTTALMLVNHEYDDSELMYPAGRYSAEEIASLGIYTHGMSVVTIKKGKTPGSWYMVKPSATATPKNRRINADTTFLVTGPAAGSDHLKTTADTSGSRVKGTFNNCAGGLTPWGTHLSGEENFNQYFGAPGGAMPANPTVAGAELANAYSRYGIGVNASDPRKWHLVDSRFDLAAEPNEPHRFGWVVEVDPMNPKSTPRKHSMLGRFKHEGANVTIAKNGKAVVYMGDDERFDYIYKFVSKGKFDPKGVIGGSASARKANMKLLETGTLYVGKFSGDGLGDGRSDGDVEWIRLCTDTQSFVEGWSVEEVLVFTRQAADLVGPTKMDRPEDVEVNPVNKRVYVALTNNTNRVAGTEDEANPITEAGTRTSPAAPLTPKTGNRNGYVMEITPTDGDHTKATASWNLFLICGDPESPETYFAGFDKTKVSRISCPDNLAFDSVGNLWISTDGALSPMGMNDGLFRVPVKGENRGQVQTFATMPKGAECCGPFIYDGDRSVFFAPQHPGEISGASFDAPASTWPHTNDYPRPSVVVAYREEGSLGRDTH
ncbi:hypothetical protein HNR19_001555 [Nocardioides thalensis]|uniref:PhoX family phosphatase n=1 Tax=Nocardioides thalensis TaxID=1914755 RepID=A0A853C142_9ACTN|nr:PhoX family phosphatase [Nocardioides thalensis]NYJ00857.1 hypothetical protein [Nocardioides thalensis]